MKRNYYDKDQEAKDCCCCPKALEEGQECICKTETVISFPNCDDLRYWDRLECGDFDCSYCH